MTFLDRGMQYKLIAYICGNACIQYSDSMGTMTFTRVYLGRPLECRYAIVSRWSVATHAEEYLVLDLYETMQDQTNGSVSPPTAMWIGADLDAAIMSAFMRYQED